jgi:glycosyltransferase involved in cell wall biosynthesis
VSRPLRLLVVSPMPPTRSGVATYTERVLQHLVNEWDVTVLVRDGEAVDATVSGVRVLHEASRQWLWEVAQPDRILHCAGNSTFHAHVPDLVGAFGGVVLVHDVRLAALQCVRAVRHPGVVDPHLLSGLVRRRYGDSLGNEILNLELAGGVNQNFHAVRQRLDEANAYLLDATVRGADALAVHSRFAQRLAGLELIDPIPIHVVPFGHDEVRPRTPKADVGSVVVATFGHVAPEKGADILIESFAISARMDPRLRLRFVGAVERAYEVQLRSRISDPDVAQRVDFTGWVDATQYHRNLQGADIAVQLRASVNGEASAAIADCFAAGIPTVVNDQGGQSELPDAAVVKVGARADASEIAQAICSLASNRNRLNDASQAAQTHARASSFSATAHALTDLLLATPLRMRSQR